MSTLTTTESRARFWLLLAGRYEAHAATAKTEKDRATWLARATAAKETAAAPIAATE